MLSQHIVSLNLNDVSLQTCLKAINQETGVGFLYSGREINKVKNITVNVTDENLVRILDQILLNNGFTYQLENEVILIRKTTEQLPEPVKFPDKRDQVKAEKNAKISGTVIDSITNESLIGANIYFEGTGIGGISDVDGRFLITGIPPGSYTLIISYIGYEPFKKQVQISSGEELLKKIQLVYSGGINLDDVVITAQAKGQIAAINQQLRSKQLKNIVSSDRIQELPDANAAESLGRLPGVSVIRSGGEGQQVVIRGLSPKYNKVVVDGIEVASTGSEDRSVSLNMISPYALEGIEVTKSGTADQDGDFVGGLINLKTRKARKGDFEADVILQTGYNGLKNSFGDGNYVVNMGKRFFDNKLGVFVQANIENRNRSANQRRIAASTLSGATDSVKNDPVFVNGMYLNDIFRERKRKGATLVFDYKLKNGDLTFRNFISSGSDAVQQYSTEYLLSRRILQFNTTDRNSDILVMNNVLEYEQQFSNFKLDAKVAHSYSESKTPNNLTFSFKKTGTAYPGIPLDVSPDSIFLYNIYGPSERNITNSISVSTYETWQRQIEGQANLEWAFHLSSGISGTLKTGGKYRYKEKFYDYELDEGDISGNAGGVLNKAIVAEFPELVPYASDDHSLIYYEGFINPDYTPSNFLSAENEEMGPVADIPFMHKVEEFARIAAANPELGAKYYRPDVPESLRHDYNGYEEYYAAYIMGTFKYKSLIDFIPGIRYEHNKASYTGAHGNMDKTPPFLQYYADYKDTTTIRNNGYWLPNVQMKVKPTQWLQLHLGYTHTLARPNYRWIIPTQHIDAVISKNNIDLQPEESENIDFAVSFHQNHLGLFTINTFAKNIDNKIFRDVRLIGDRYEEFDLSEQFSGRQIISHYNDTSGVKIRGLELDWQTNFWYLPKFFKGFVLNVNYTYISSEAKYPHHYIIKEPDPNDPWREIVTVVDTTYTTRLIDQPNHTMNISLGYDYKGFAIRLSMLYNADIFRSPTYQYENRGYSDDYIRWDISVKQDLPIKGMQVFINLNNITGAKEIYYINGASYPVNIEHYGMTMDAGLRWRL